MKGLGEVHGYKYLYLQNAVSKSFQIWKLARTSMEVQNDKKNNFFFTKMVSLSPPPPPLIN